MKWELSALKMLAKNQTVPGIALKDAISEIEALRRKLVVAEATIAEAQARIKELEQAQAKLDLLEDCLQEIDNWCKAYPIKVFPEPDLERAHTLLKAGGITLDSVSASNMRHVLNGIQEIIARALPQQPESEEK